MNTKTELKRARLEELQIELIKIQMLGAPRNHYQIPMLQLITNFLKHDLERNPYDPPGGSK